MATMTVTTHTQFKGGDDEVTSVRRRTAAAMAKVTGNEDSADVDPLDESEQDLVISKFEQDIRDQFVLLRRVMLALCVVWELLIFWMATQPQHLCKFADTGSFSSQTPTEFECPAHAMLLFRAVALSVGIVTHVLTFAFLVLGNKALLRLGFYSLLLPVGAIGYCVTVGTGGAAAAAVQTAAAQGLAAVGNFENSVRTWKDV